MLQKDAIENSTLELLRLLQNDELLKDFHLAGGTGLALQIGHRLSIDIDLFSRNQFNEEHYLIHLENQYGFVLDFRDKNTLKGAIDNVKVDLITHNYKNVFDIQLVDGLRIFSMEDIAAMKVNAIAGDGTQVKDFIDLYFLLKEFSFKEVIDFFETKYEQRNAMHAVKSTIYFDDVDLSDWPKMIKETNLTWKIVKNSIDAHCNNFLKELKSNS